MGENAIRIWEAPLLINCFSVVILFIFLSDNHHKNHSIKSKRYIYFQYMVIANILLLIMDSICWLVVGNADPPFRTVHIIATMIFYTLNPLPSYFFIRFTDIVLNTPVEKQKSLMHWYIIPVALHLIITLVSPFTGWFFRIDAANEYQRGSILLGSFFLSFVLMFIAGVKVLIRYTKAGKENNDIAKNITQYSWLLKFTAIPLIGGLIQALFNNVTYVWNVSVIALLILYINNQNVEITTDTLTGVYNRRQAFAYFDRFMRECEKEKDKNRNEIAVIVLDINSFKSINDQYGHARGDEAIITVARCLEMEFHWDDFICRFGGDEFVVITKHGDERTLKSAIQRVNNSLRTMYDKGYYPYELSLSAGYAILSKRSKTLDSLFQKADAMMFEQKALLKRRASDRANKRM